MNADLAKLTCVTLTGAEESTPLSGALSLALCLPPGVKLEIGLLFSLTPEGRNRYPSETWLRRAVGALRESCAVHVCGRAARAAVLANSVGWIKDAARIQLNGTLSLDEVRRAAGLFSEVITQLNWTSVNNDLLSSGIPNHSILVDGSGGRGRLPKRWKRPITNSRIGFAGGLGASTIPSELPKIAAVAKGDYWIDMEQSLRDDQDRFNLVQATHALEAVRHWCMMKEN